MFLIDTSRVEHVQMFAGHTFCYWSLSDNWMVCVCVCVVGGRAVKIKFLIDSEVLGNPDGGVTQGQQLSIPAPQHELVSSSNYWPTADPVKVYINITF